MSTLNGQQINNTYQGLLKTDTNGPIANPGSNLLTDGLGNSTQITLELVNVPNVQNALQFESNGNPRYTIKNTAWNKSNYPMGTTSGQLTGINLTDGNGNLTGTISQDRYGGVYYQNINGDQAESHVFSSVTNTGAATPATIRMDTYNGINNSNNWYLGYQQSVDALTVVGDQLTLGRQDAADLVVTLPSGGGGAAGFVAGTQPNSMKSADTLSDPIAQATANGAIAIGRNAQASGVDSQSIGVWSASSGVGSTAIGNGTQATANEATSIGRNSRAMFSKGTVVGSNSYHGSQSGTVIGSDSQYFGANGPSSTIVGSNINASASTSFQNSILIGAGFTLPADQQNDLTAIGTGLNISGNCSNSITMGLVATLASSNDAVGIGRQNNISGSSGGTALGANTSVTAAGGTAIGQLASVTASNAVAIGASVVGARANTATVNKLEIAEVGAGVIMYSPDGTAYQVTIANGGAIITTAI